MSENGKLCDVLVKESWGQDIYGVEKFFYLDVWAEPGMENVIQSVPGVSMASSSPVSDTCYMVFLDPRYDREWVKAEIEAQIKINMKSL